MPTTSKPRHPSKRPAQFNRRAPFVPLRRVEECERGRGKDPCGVCARCDHETAAFFADHPAELSLEQVARLW